MRRVVEANVAVVIDDGYELLPGALAALAAAVHGGALLATGAVRFHGDDDLHAASWMPSALTPEATLSDPRGVPPAWSARAPDMERLDVDSGLGALSLADLWLRALCSVPGSRAVAIPDTVARRAIVAPTRWERLLDDPEYPALLRQFFIKHQATLERLMRPVLVDREVAFGRLRASHQESIAQRDARLRELDELRAAAAHHRAFLAHHRLDGLEWGSFGRTDPVARDWGYGRGGPVDRRYIREFVASHSSDVRGRVLEIQEDDLSRAYGGARVEQADVLDVDASNPKATVVADLRSAPELMTGTYDCIVLTQTAHVIDDMDAVMRECLRLLKPGGVLLATFPCVSRVCLEYGPAGDFWRVTPAGARVLVDRAFGSGVAEVCAYGNVKTSVAFLHGLGEHELSDADYAATDMSNPMLVGVRARKPVDLPPEDGGHTPAIPSRSVPSALGRKGSRGVVLAYHRIASGGPDRFDLSVPPELFQAHVAMLQRRGAVVPLHDFLALDPQSLPDRAVALTFDDGYAAHLTDVAPVLETLGVPATFFVTTAPFERDDEHWWDLLERLNPPDLRRWHDALVNAQPAERQELIADLQQSSGMTPHVAPDPPRFRAMTAAEVRELAGRPGMTIGAHGVRHLLLPHQTPDVQEQEMRASRAALEAAAHVAVRLFAYPYGGVDDATAALARQMFTYSCGCAPAAVGWSFDAGRVPRLDVKRWTVEELESRIGALCAPARDERVVRFLP